MSSDSSPPDGPPPDEPPTGTPPTDDEGSAEASSDAPPPEEPAAAPPLPDEPVADEPPAEEAAPPPEEPVADAPPAEEPAAAPPPAEEQVAAAPPPEEVPPPAGDEVTEAPESEAAPPAPPSDADVTAEAPLAAGALAAGPPPAEELRGEGAPTAPGTGPLRILAYAVVIGGLILMVAGAFTWYVVRDQLKDEKITVSEDADRFAGDQVDNPWTAYAQADVINEHALEASDGLTYAQLDQDDPRRDTVMTASFLRASLYTSVVSFGVAAFAFGLGLLMIIIGWALLRINRSLRAQRT